MAIVTVRYVGAIIGAHNGVVPRSTFEIATRTGRVAIAAYAGHVVEWYEFSIFGVLAAYLAMVVFPAEDPFASLVLTWVAFAVAFFVRPIGGILFAQLADRAGRRTALMATVTLMTTATVGIGLVPGHTSIGILAPLLFVAMRMLQGFAVGGEMPSAVPYFAESLARTRRARAMGWLASGPWVASLGGALAAATLAGILPADAMQSWGWRIPFLLALPLGVLAIWLRRHAPESEAFIELAARGAMSRRPFGDAVRTAWRPMLAFGALALSFNVTIAACLTGLLSEVLLGGLDPAVGLWYSVCAYVLLTIAILGAARVADRLGRRRMMALGAATAIVLVTPAVMLARTGALPLAVLSAALMAIPIGLLAVPSYLALGEMFPVPVRASAGGISFNLATALSSLVPSTTLAARRALGFDDALIVWVASAAVVLLIVLVASRESFGYVDR